MTSGDRLGPYEIVSFLGKGGMGNVYRARDSRLGRDVAIKISSALFNERFQREARAIAAFNHPGICTLYDVGSDGASSYLVMELVEGHEPRGPLPLTEVLNIAGQIAAALAVAHDKGIVHRDLKPANVKMTPSGAVKVLDFGLAKALLESSPGVETLTLQTQIGTVVGTPSYMAPEQAQGAAVDKRADVWAFGVLIYELLTGERPFDADSTQSTLMAVLTRDPNLAKVPAAVQPLLRACLKKDPKQRLSNIGDWHLLVNPEPAPMSGVDRASHVHTADSSRRRFVPWVLGAAVLLLSAAVAALAWLRPPSPAPPPVVLFEIPIPDGLASQTMFTLSPDGKHLAMSTPQDGKYRLVVRSLDSLDARSLPGTEGARWPFWSPDSEQIAFFAGGMLKTVRLSSGNPSIIASVDPSIQGAAWGARGVIVLSQRRQLFQVSDKGGSPALLYSAEQMLRFPAFLPDGHHLLFWGDGIQVGDLDRSPPVKLLPDTTAPRYVSGGYLMFERQGRVVAQPFDPRTLTVSGTAVPITGEVSATTSSNAFAVSAAGIVAHQSRLIEQLTWVDRHGAAQQRVGEPQAWSNFRVSRDQSKIVTDVRSQGRYGVAVFDVRRGTLERLTTATSGLFPVFSPDGRHVAFTSPRTGRFNPYVTDGVNQERMVADVGTTGGYPVDWSPDGRDLLYWGDEDLWIVPVSGSGKPTTFAKTPFEERDGTFSPDGRWIAYVSNQSGKDEVYVQSFPAEGGRRYTVSSGGANSPTWRRDGKELYFVSNGRLTAMPVASRGNELDLGGPEPLFPMVGPGSGRRSYEVSPDGQRFLIGTPPPGGSTITILMNWQGLLEPQRH